eukprot:scaffold246601_cov32-Tisochrysis_lutea.AAC.2
MRYAFDHHTPRRGVSVSVASECPHYQARLSSVGPASMGNGAHLEPLNGLAKSNRAIQFGTARAAVKECPWYQSTKVRARSLSILSSIPVIPLPREHSFGR